MNDKEKIQEFCKINIQNYAQDTAINLDQNIWALAVLEPTELHVSCLTYSYQIKIESSFKLIELDNSCQVYNPNFILPSSNLIKEKLNQSLIMDRFFNYDLKYTSIPNFFLMNTFNITKLTQEQLDTLAYDLPPVCNIPLRNVTSMLKPINKNYPFIFPTYGYVLLTIGGTTLTIMVIGILYYAKYKRARAAAAPSKQNQSPPSKEDIEMVSLQSTTNKQMTKHLGHKVAVSDSEPMASMATPLLIQK